MNGQNPVSTVGKPSTPDAAGNDNIAQQPASNQPTDNGNEHNPLRSHGNVTNSHFYIRAGFTRNCNHCGREYVAKRSTSKFCSGTCRKYAFDERQAAKAV